MPLTYSRGGNATDQPAPPDIVTIANKTMFSYIGQAELGGQTTGGNFTWPSANKPVAIPFYLWQPKTVYQLGWLNGSGTMTDSVDIGIYDSSWVRKVSAGSTALSGASSLQFVNVTDTPLTAPAKYYLVMSCNGTTANQLNVITGTVTQMLVLAGCFDSATNAFPLPDPLTNMVAAATFVSIPNMYIAFRSLI